MNVFFKEQVLMFLSRPRTAYSSCHQITLEFTKIDHQGWFRRLATYGISALANEWIIRFILQQVLFRREVILQKPNRLRKQLY